jgi:pimeloyl-ACP methyl ester carboxylesterase
VQENRHVAEVTHLMSRAAGWPAGLRWIVRRTKPSRRQMKNLTAFERSAGWRYSDIDREITPAALASDVAGLLAIDRARIFGHSMGGAATLELGINHPDRVRSLVPASASVRPDGLHEDLTDPARQATSARMPAQQDFLDFQDAYQRLSPHPDHFNDFLTTLSQSTADTQGWSDEQLATITAPTLLVLGDRDFTTVEHGALMQQLIPGAQLAILPGTTHMQVTRRADLLLPMLARFLD